MESFVSVGILNIRIWCFSISNLSNPKMKMLSWLTILLLTAGGGPIVKSIGDIRAQPDKCVILVTANFKTHEKRNVRCLAKFLNLVVPRYGYEFLAVENNEELNRHLNLMEVPIKHSNCYFAPLGEDLKEMLES